MRVLVTGQSGLDKRQFLEDVIRLCNKKDARRCDPDVRLDKNSLRAARIDGFLDLESEFQDSTGVANYLDMNESVFIEGKKRILSKFRSKYTESQNVIVATHLAYFRKKSFYHKMDWDAFRAFDPQLIVTLIDDVTSVSARIKGRDQVDDYVRSTTLKDLMVWREVETMLGQALAQNLNPGKPIRHYLVAIGHGSQILYQLMFEKKKKVYASFPITEAKSDPTLAAQAERFRKALRKDLIVFDPSTIKEKLLHDGVLDLLGGVVPSATGTINVGGEEYGVEELLPVLTDITGQIITRDERLVAQSQAVIAYRPARSAGSLHELSFAEELGKRIIAYHPKEDRASPFVMKSGLLVGDFETFLKRIEKYAHS